MRLLLAFTFCLLSLTAHAAGPLDEELWGSRAQGWEELSEFDLTPASVVVELNQDALSLNNQELAPLMIEIAQMGPRPQRTGDKDADLKGFFAWNERLEKDVLKTKFGGGDLGWLVGDKPERRPTADDWYFAFSQMRRLRLYEAAGYRVIGMESVLYSDVGWRHLFLLVRE